MHARARAFFRDTPGNPVTDLTGATNPENAVQDGVGQITEGRYSGGEGVTHTPYLLQPPHPATVIRHAHELLNRTLENGLPAADSAEPTLDVARELLDAAARGEDLDTLTEICARFEEARQLWWNVVKARGSRADKPTVGSAKDINDTEKKAKAARRAVPRSVAHARPVPTLDRDREPEGFDARLNKAFEKIVGTEDEDFALHVGTSAASFYSWTGGKPLKWKAPHGYATRLTKAVAWLQTQTDRLAARRAVLRQLRALWPQYSREPQHDGDAAPWASLPGAWTPDEDALARYPKDATLPDLPVWADTPDGRLCEAWDCYSGALVALNAVLRRPLLDTSEDPS